MRPIGGGAHVNSILSCAVCVCVCSCAWIIYGLAFVLGIGGGGGGLVRPVADRCAGVSVSDDDGPIVVSYLSALTRARTLQHPCALACENVLCGSTPVSLAR